MAQQQAEAARVAAEQEAARVAAEQKAAADAEAARLAAREANQGTSVYYKNCDAVRAAGAAPIRRDDPGYGSHLDRDGDGEGCGSD